MNAEITVSVVLQRLQAGILVVVRVLAPGAAEADDRRVAQQLRLERLAAVFAFALKINAVLHETFDPLSVEQSQQFLLLTYLLDRTTIPNGSTTHVCIFAITIWSKLEENRARYNMIHVERLTH